MPTLGGGLLGRRGFLWGVLIIFSFLVLFTILSFLQIEMFPFSNHETFLSQMKLNLVLFAIATFYFADTHTRSELDFVKNLQDEKMKNETLLRVLFHDLANPMQTIRMMIRKMKKVEEKNNLAKNVELLDRTSIRIVEILENVRKMKAVEDHKFLFNKEVHSVSDSINKAVELFEKQISEKNIKVEVNSLSSPDFKIVIDQTIFSYQILGNLISNSIKFSNSGEKIKINWWKELDEQEESFIHISIEDRGIGIPEDILKNIFELQGQVSRRGTSGEMGTGYGMPLVKAFVTEFNGTIQINSPISMPDGNLIKGTQYLLKFKLAE